VTSATVTKQNKKNTRAQAVPVKKRNPPKTLRVKQVAATDNSVMDLPRTQRTEALRFKNKSRQDINSKLKKSSPWFISLCDPLHGAGEKIPDDVGEETGCLQLVQRGIKTVPSLANACAGVKTFTLHPSGTDATQGYTVTSDSTSTQSSVDWFGGSAWDTTPTLQSFARGVRVVSAAIYVQPECTLADASGEMTLFSIPNVDNTAITAYDDYAQAYGSVQVPMNNTGAVMAKWYPIKMVSDVTSNAFLDYSAFYDPAKVMPPYWTMGFVTAGVPSGVSFRYTIAINYEFLPSLNSIDILDAKPSPNDATEVDLVENWIQSEPVARPVSKKAMMTPPSPPAMTRELKEADDESGFGMFFDVIKELAPLALEGAALLL
jgi:hypothetical protein